MLIDAAKGVEPQTKKLFAICRERGIPLFTFMNKLDRPSRDPLELLDELESVLGIGAFPMNWPLGNGEEFKGVYDRHTRMRASLRTCSARRDARRGIRDGRRRSAAARRWSASTSTGSFAKASSCSMAPASGSIARRCCAARSRRSSSAAR